MSFGTSLSQYSIARVYKVDTTWRKYVMLDAAEGRGVLTVHDREDIIASNGSTVDSFPSASLAVPQVENGDVVYKLPATLPAPYPPPVDLNGTCTIEIPASDVKVAEMAYLVLEGDFQSSTAFSPDVHSFEIDVGEMLADAAVIGTLHQVGGYYSKKMLLTVAGLVIPSARGIFTISVKWRLRQKDSITSADDTFAMSIRVSLLGYKASTFFKLDYGALQEERPCRRSSNSEMQQP